MIGIIKFKEVSSNIKIIFLYFFIDKRLYRIIRQSKGIMQNYGIKRRGFLFLLYKKNI